MFTAYVLVTSVAVAANAFSAVCDFLRYEPVLVNMARHGVPRSWITLLGLAKAAGAIGLVVGFALPPVGVAAATGLVLFFVAAVVSHVRVRDEAMGPAFAFLALAVAALVLRLVV